MSTNIHEIAKLMGKPDDVALSFCRKVQERIGPTSLSHYIIKEAIRKYKAEHPRAKVQPEKIASYIKNSPSLRIMNRLRTEESAAQQFCSDVREYATKPSLTDMRIAECLEQYYKPKMTPQEVAEIITSPRSIRRRIEARVLAENEASGKSWVSPESVGAHLETWPGADRWKNPSESHGLYCVFNLLLAEYYELVTIPPEIERDRFFSASSVYQ